ncbi:MAG TPA: hypothetical protein VMQ76_14125, partial [Terracidiphilus sp.]|nr:hypothetical protein [Terracidiphilus sp.]
MILPKGRVPHGGWNFPVAEGVKLEGQTEEILTKNIYEYRLRNNIPIGDIEQDINAYYCKNWPDNCVKEAHEMGGPRAEFPHSEPIGNRVARWASMLLHSMPPGGHKLVMQPEATSRARVCIDCPKNTPWRGGCGGCSKSAVTLLAQLRKTNRTPHDGNLMACGVTGWDNCTAAWCTEAQLPITEEQRAAMPDKCWRKE